MKFFRVCAAMLLLTVMVQAQEHQCPSDHAANRGYKAFEAFHEVMAPAWHSSYPDKDYDALVAAAPKFDSLFEGIATIEAKMNNPKRKAAFLTHREEFAQLVKAYSEAAKAGLKDSVYALMPGVHEAFEMTASVLMPYSFPALEGVMVTTSVIMDTHLPANNMEGITGSTETLITKVAALNEETIPEELKDQKEPLLKEFEAINKMAVQLKESCDKKDMDTYKKVATELNTKLHEVETTYL